MAKKDKHVKLSIRGKAILISSVSCGIAFSGAASTVSVLAATKQGTNNAPTVENSDIVIEQDAIKNKLFENLTAANIDFHRLELSVKNLGGEGKNLTFAFRGSVKYLSFMEEYMGYGDAVPTNTPSVAASFGGQANVLYEDTLRDDEGKKMVDEQLNIYNPGTGKTYIEWNKTGYKASGTLINNALAAVPEFVSDLSQIEDIAGYIESIDVLSLLPMVGNVGGSLFGEDAYKGVEGAKKHLYTANIPETLLKGVIPGGITLDVECDDSGNLTALHLHEISINAAGMNLKIELKTVADGVLESDTGIVMQGINSRKEQIALNTIEDYGLVSATKDSLEEFYTNDLDYTPNLAYTVAKLINAKQYKANYSINFDEYVYDENSVEAVNFRGLTPTYKHKIGGEMAATLGESLDDASLRFTMDSNHSTDFANDLSVIYQGKKDENHARGVYATFNDSINVYLDTENVADMMKPLLKSADTAAIDTSEITEKANSVLTDSTIGNIINGKYYMYHDILDKIMFTHDDMTGESAILVDIKAKGLEMDVPFEFLNSIVSLEIRYSPTNEDGVVGDRKTTLVREVAVKNIPFRKTTRDGVTYADTGSIVINLDENGIGKAGDPAFVEDIDLDKKGNYVNMKPAVTLVDKVADVVSQKKFTLGYEMEYMPEGVSKNYVVDGKITADMNDFAYKLGDSLVDKNHGQYELTANALVNDIQHHVIVDYRGNAKEENGIYFKYFSQNENYQTRLALKNQTMTNAYEVITRFLAKQDVQTEVNEEELKEQAYDKLTSTLEAYLNYADGKIWNILNSRFDDSLVKVAHVTDDQGNKDEDTLKVSINTKLFGADLAGGKIDFVLDADAEKNNESIKQLTLDVTLPENNPVSKHSDRIKLNLFLGEFEEFSVTNFDNYRDTDKTVDAVMKLIDGDYFNAIKVKGVLSNKRTTPRP